MATTLISQAVRRENLVDTAMVKAEFTVRAKISSGECSLEDKTRERARIFVGLVRDSGLIPELQNKNSLMNRRMHETISNHVRAEEAGKFREQVEKRIDAASCDA